MTGVAVAIVGYRCPQEIASCVASLTRSRHPILRVSICENGGGAAFDEVVAQLANTLAVEPVPAQGSRKTPSRILRTASFAGPLGAVGDIAVHEASCNLGYAGAANAMLGELDHSSDWSTLWLLNPDTEPQPDALSELVAYVGDREYGVVGSRLVVKKTGRVQLYGGRWRRWLGRGYNIGLGSPGDADVDTDRIEREQHYVSGAAMFVSRRFITSVGPMSEDYFLYGEEVDWCLRRRDFRLGYAHRSVVMHDHGAIIGSSVDRRSRSALSVFLDERSRMLVTRRFYPKAFPVAAAAALALTGQYLRAGAFSNFGVALAGWWAGMRGETGRPSWVAPVATSEPS